MYKNLEICQDHLLNDICIVGDFFFFFVHSINVKIMVNFIDSVTGQMGV